MPSSTPPDDIYAETLAVFDRGDDPSEPLTTPEVAAALDRERRTVYKRLETLVERGDLKTKKTGARARVWWRPPSAAADSDRAEPSADGPLPPESDVGDVLDSATVGVFVLDSDRRIAWINEATERYFGLDRSEVVGRDEREVLRETLSETVAEPGALEAAIDPDDESDASDGNGAPDGTVECHVTPADGREERWLEYRSDPIDTGRYAGGRVDLYYDVTDRKREQEEHRLQSSLSQSIAAAESLEDGLRTALEDVCQWTDWEVGQAWVPTGEGYVERLPESYVESSEFDRFDEASTEFTFAPGEGIPGRVLESKEPVWFPDVSAVSADVYPRTAQAADVGLRAGLGIPVVADGRLAVVLEFYMSERREVDEHLVEIVSAVGTELGGLVARRQVEKLLDQERMLLEEVMESAPVGISVFSTDEGVDRMNSHAAALRGFSDGDVSEFRVDDCAFYDEDGDPVPFEDRPFATVLETGDPVYDWTARIERPDGSRKWVSINAAPILTDAGEIEQIVTVDEDVTELGEQYRAITEAANDVIVTVDEDSTIRSVNPAVEDVFGYGQSELTGKPLTVLMPDELTQQHRAALRRYLETGERTLDWEYVELPGVRADGTRLSLAVSFSEIEYEGATYFTGVIRDVTDRKERERALREERDLIERIIETSPVGIATLDADGTFDRINDRTAEILGYRPEETGDYAQRVEVLDPIAPDEERLAPDEIPTYRVFEDGETIHDVEVGLQRPDGERVWVSVSGSPMRDDGEVTGAVITFADVTDRIEYERKLEESNERLEQFAYAASHDLQEPLRMVSSYLQLLEDRYADELDADGEEFIDYAVDGAERMKAMIEGLLEYSRVETQGDPFEPVDLDAVLEDARADLQVRIEDEDAEISAEALPTVRGDANQLRQVFQNLLSNAIEYSGDEPPRIRVGVEPRGPERVVSVRDEGIGIDPDQRDRIFQVFQRLHSREDHPGTGIGLALCRRIVERHGGEIWADSDPGEGSTFSFTLPVSDADH